MRLIGRGAIITLVALYVPVLLGLPALWAVTLPIGAALMVGLRRREPTGEELSLVTDAQRRQKRKRSMIVIAVCALIVLIGSVIGALVSEPVHDAWWPLFVGPPFMAAIVGALALLMLGWTFVPRRSEYIP